mmetsp:Transcript_66788/g.105671  ORF Transcript_66788/g.105671 Transcript_66788/m.105671 type:complete len:794 (+) Transcript_66788:59-2440(+)|eukprot:CAMPEP_0169078436 /NCGR_PEP_ID=MMETSP1015-20121227/9409_1 /TAXON_ID=342587 /ORGANISM="Karlodinium micrum, Strain CCMP2283" /LENGTH=793 /DNA_ID=CAMNT_0009138023 /DNA_START=59 /DNA_END=2440 /DNA_ORIENTATION=+
MGCVKSTAKCDDPSTPFRNGGDIFDSEVLEKCYKVDVKMLGSGSYAKVYRAVEIKTKQVVAVKRIDKEGSRRELLDTEITIMRRFAMHKHIVRLFACFETQTEVQLVMEFMPGGELFDVLAVMGPYGEVQAAEHAKAIASALEHLHRNNVAHRDLKPENLLLTAKPPAKGLLKICDFGLAKVLQKGEVMNRPCGTWAYSAPEVLRIRKTGNGSYDTQCDMFAVGVLVFVILAGYHPFDVDGQQTEKQMQDNIIENNWDFDDPAWDGVSKNAKDLITALLQPNPAKRLRASALRNHEWVCGASPYGNLSDAIHRDVKSCILRMKQKKLKAGMIAVESIFVLEGNHKHAEALRRWDLIRRAWKTGELAKMAPLTFASTVTVVRKQWLRDQNTPGMLSGPRQELIQKCFKQLDTDQNGYLNGQELFRFAKTKGFPGNLAAWLVEYKKLCSECSWSVGAGSDYPSFELLVNTSDCCFYSTRKDLLHLLDQADPSLSMCSASTSSKTSPRGGASGKTVSTSPGDSSGRTSPRDVSVSSAPTIKSTSPCNSQRDSPARESSLPARESSMLSLSVSMATSPRNGSMLSTSPRDMAHSLSHAARNRESAQIPPSPSARRREEVSRLSDKAHPASPSASPTNRKRKEGQERNSSRVHKDRDKDKHNSRSKAKSRVADSMELGHSGGRNLKGQTLPAPPRKTKAESPSNKDRHDRSHRYPTATGTVDFTFGSTKSMPMGKTKTTKGGGQKVKKSTRQSGDKAVEESGVDNGPAQYPGRSQQETRKPDREHLRESLAMDSTKTV